MNEMNWNGRRVTGAVLLALVVTVVALLAGVQIGSPIHPINYNYTTNIGTSQPTVPNNVPIGPALLSADQRAMFGQFRLATSAEAALLQAYPDFKDDPSFQHIYVAERTEVTLTPIKIPMVVILPTGTRWVSGARGMITVVRVPALTKDGIGKFGVPFADALCTLEMFGVLSGDCLDPAVQKPAAWNDMIRHTRYATTGELREWFGSKGEGLDPKRYLVAIRNLRLAPEYRFNKGEPSDQGIDSIFVPAGIKVLGGQLGYMDVIPVGTGPYTRIALDTDCFMNEVSEANNRPASFMPATETKRVERCVR